MFETHWNSLDHTFSWNEMHEVLQKNLDLSFKSCSMAIFWKDVQF